MKDIRFIKQFFLFFVLILSISWQVEAQEGSYSAANNKIGSYGVAHHDPSSLLKLGTLNNTIDKHGAAIYLPGNTTPQLVNPNYDGLVSVAPKSAGGYSAMVSVKNDKSVDANVAAWIDFNGNGVFDANEISSIVIVPANTTGNYALEWTLPSGTKSQLETYLRVRVTTDALDGTQSAGEASDGEVEDYVLTLDLLSISKTALSNIVVNCGGNKHNSQTNPARIHYVPMGKMLPKYSNDTESSKKLNE